MKLQPMMLIYATLLGKTTDVDNGNSFVENTKIVVPLKYLRIFWKSLEMPLINGNIYFEWNWIKDYILSSIGDSGQ